MEDDDDSSTWCMNIDAVWNDNKHSGIVIKEENISDIETEPHEEEQLNTNAENCNSKKLNIDQEEMDEQQLSNNSLPENASLLNSVIRFNDPLNIQQTRIGRSFKPGRRINSTPCTHPPKNLKVFKKKFRCGDCSAPACPECSKVVQSTVQSHLLDSNAQNKKTYPCRFCDMFFLSYCAQMAHTRLHRLDAPYVCPDCGVVYNNIYFLTLHLINKCFHVYKIVRFKCSCCFSSFANVQEFHKHLLLFYRCSTCKKVNVDFKTLRKHKLAEHRYEKVDHTTFVRCTTCTNDKICKDQTLSYHFALHCPCGQQYNSPSGFRAHFQNCSKRGVLPDQWQFLQARIKSSDAPLGDHDEHRVSDVFSMKGPAVKPCEICGKLLKSVGDKKVTCIRCKITQTFEEDEDDEEEEEEGNLVIDEDNRNKVTIKSDENSKRSTEVSKLPEKKRGTPVVNEKTLAHVIVKEPALICRKEIKEVSDNNKGIIRIDLTVDVPEEPTVLSGKSSKVAETGETVVEATVGNGNETAKEAESDEKKNASSEGNSIKCPNEGDNNVLGESITEEIVGKGIEIENENEKEPDEKNVSNEEIEMIDRNDNGNHCNDGNDHDEFDNENEDDDEPAQKGEQIYNHIPTDHLGYLKTSEENSGSVPEENDSRFHYQDVLDEQTGMITSKKVLVEDLTPEVVWPAPEVIDLEDNARPDSPDLDLHQIPRDKPKPRLRSSQPFLLYSEVKSTKVLPAMTPPKPTIPTIKIIPHKSFACPFCSVEFPMHSTSFQRFRLHVECYHSDAGVDIPVHESYLSQVDKNPRSLIKHYVVEPTKTAPTAKSDTPRPATSSKSVTPSRPAASARSATPVRPAPVAAASTAAASNAASPDVAACNAAMLKRAILKRKRKIIDVGEKGGASLSLVTTTTSKPSIVIRQRRAMKSKNDKSNSVSCAIVEDNENDGIVTVISPVKGRETEKERLKEKTSISNEVKKTKEKTEPEKVGLIEKKKVKTLKTPNEAPEKASETGKQSDKKIESSPKENKRSTPVQESSSVTNTKSEKRTPPSVAENIFEENVANGSAHRSTSVKSLVRAVRKEIDGTLSVLKSYVPKSTKSQNSSSNEESSDEGKPHPRSILRSSKKRPSEEKTPEDEQSPKKEREVWSEFYQNLKHAEKLKNKSKRPITDVNGEEKDSVTSKRIVKKPKRFSEDLWSGGSGDGSGEETHGGWGESDTEEKKVEVVPKKKEDNVKNEETKINEKETENSVKKRTLESEKELPKEAESDCKSEDKPPLPNEDDDQDTHVQYWSDVLEKRQNPFQLAKKKVSDLLNFPEKESISRLSRLMKRGRGRPRKYLKPNPDGPDPDDNEADPVENSEKDDSTHTETPRLGKRGRPRKHDKTDNHSTIKDSSPDTDKEVNFLEKIFDTDKSESSSIKRKRRLSTKLVYYKQRDVADKKDDFSSGQVISSKNSSSDKSFVCAICKESLATSAEFRQHILTHRMDENTHQCMECGECFVVRPSLEKHLHAFHKIQDTDKYINENECSTPPKLEEAPVPEPLKENQCKVCLDEFTSTADLNKHFRIHGVAFLKEFMKEKT